ncbi:MAG: GNAT family N-acetyltransferase [Desulfomonilaceae bacterium]|nr:GNAT family N-acetyltransferase [Desulfomonilaceae bacterium]
MADSSRNDWKGRTVSPDSILHKIEPGMSIFVGTGVAEPRTLVKRLMTADRGNLTDLELIQLVSLGDAISLEALSSHKYRLKTFFSGWVASEAITQGRVDLIPSRFARIPDLIKSGRITIDVAFVQITPPAPSGYCSLGVGVDAARRAIEQADLVVGEINSAVPVTYGDTFVHVSEFDYFVNAEEPPLYFPRWPLDEVFDRVAANVASVIEDGSCIAFSIGPLFEGLSRHLMKKRHLGVHSPFVTDALMDLIVSGAVTNRFKGIFRGKSLATYAFGTRELMAWLDRNPLVEFQSLEQVFSPAQIGLNNRFVAVIPARKVDITGRIAFHVGKGNVSAGPGETMDFLNGAEMSRGGLTVFALPSRNLKNQGNILVSLGDIPNQLTTRESVDMVVTEYGVAWLRGRTVRERAQALIEVAHPEDRPELVEQAKEFRILYPDQIFLKESAELYPAEVKADHLFKGDLRIRFRAIRPSDEEGMRRLFYRFSDESVYYRYFSPIKSMPHSKIQEYVNVDFSKTMSIVGLVGEPGRGRIIAEARYVRLANRPYGDVAFVVDEEYQGKGIASFMFKMLIQLAKERGLQGFTADVVASNRSMMKVFENSGLPVKARLEMGVYEVTMPFERTADLDGPK